METQKCYLILIVPLLESIPSSSLWLQVRRVEIQGEEYFQFDWTSEIRETIYFDSKEEAQKVADKHAEIVQPRFCSVVEVKQHDVKFLGISKGKKLENLRLLDY
ncbi:hypothetical protein [Enterococcus sp. AZ126]|uniref:hypothetical protein n=1 Tax=Enterococcus sp. AZ126 TaxID=2774635 RepID=UPI003F272F67